jgi:hypothetical protein
MKYIYAFDVDETLNVSGGPVDVEVCRELARRGHIVGICGNWMQCVANMPDWHKTFSFLGQMLMTKTDFLKQIKAFIPADAYIMVGNDPRYFGSSQDYEAAMNAGWVFYRESEFHIDVVPPQIDVPVKVVISLPTSELGTWENDFDFFYVGCHDESGRELYRRDLSTSELNAVKAHMNLVYTLDYKGTPPTSYTVWTHSKSKGWLTKVTKDVHS